MVLSYINMKNKSMEFRISSYRRTGDHATNKRKHLYSKKGSLAPSATNSTISPQKCFLLPFSPAKSQSSKSTLPSLTLSSTLYPPKLSTHGRNTGLSCSSWCLYDLKASKCSGFREHSQREIASITKIMTTIITLQFLHLHDVPRDVYVKVTENASKHPGTTAALKHSTWINLWDVLYGVMLPSGNDAAFLLGEVIGYWEKNKQALEESKSSKTIDLSNHNTNLNVVQFIKMMNRKAEELGLLGTKFSNPHGLQNALNTSTAKDVIDLSVYASKHEEFAKIMGTERYGYRVYAEPPALGGRVMDKKRWWNTNQLLQEGWQGLKTGRTQAAGSCLSSVRDSIFIVVLNCKDSEARFTETRQLYHWYTNQ